MAKKKKKKKATYCAWDARLGFEQNLATILQTRSKSMSRVAKLFVKELIAEDTLTGMIDAGLNACDHVTPVAVQKMELGVPVGKVHVYKVKCSFSISAQLDEVKGG